MPEKVDHVQSLARLLERHGFIPEPQVNWMFVSVLRDLELRHGQAQLHLDIKPANIVRAPGGAYRLVGYGESWLGTARYMAPERVRRRNPDERSDLYSLGVALYEAAVGRPIYESSLNYELLDAHLNKWPAAPQSVRPGVSSELGRIIMTALAKEPDARFQTAREFREPLERLAKEQTARSGSRKAGVPAAVNGQPGPAAARGRPRARPLPAAVLAVVVLGAAGLALVAWGRRSVPGFVGKSRDAAEALAGRAGLVLVIAGESDDTARAGAIVRQSPPSGAGAWRGGKVTVWVSTGFVELPELAGRDTDASQAELGRLRLEVGRIDSGYSDEHSPGTVLVTIPAAGARVEPGSTVAVTVAAGRATCPECGARRRARARFCSRCWYRFEP